MTYKALNGVTLKTFSAFLGSTTPTLTKRCRLFISTLNNDYLIMRWSFFLQNLTMEPPSN